MIHSCTISLLLLLAILPAPTVSSDTPKSLQFGSTLSDYVKFTPDMSRVKNALTICSWVRKMLTGDYRAWFSCTTMSHSHELLISDAGGFNYIHSDRINFKDRVTVPLNTWTHQCQSWSTSTGQMRVYYNGTLIGTKTFSNRAPLEEGGYILLGHDSGSQDNREVFGGRLLKLNVFGRVLSDEEIARMYAAGMCSEVEKNYDDVRYITWERILRETKTGNVREVESGCPAPEEEEEEEVEEEEEEECICPSFSMWDVLLGEKYLNQNLTEEKLTELKSTWTILGGIITHFKTYHPKAGLGCPVSEEEEEEEDGEEEEEEEEEEDCACPAHSMWDVLLEENYLNQNLTDDKLTELKSAWSILDHFVGTTITNGIVAHLKMFHPKAGGECETEPES